MKLLMSSAGRRVGLMRCFRRAFERLGMAGRILAVDASADAPALQEADEQFLAPLCEDPSYIDWLEELCLEHGVDAVVPNLYDEGPLLAANRDRFEAVGAKVWVSSPQTLAIACDKRRMHAWLAERGFPVPRQADPAQAARRPDQWPLPLVVKPVSGSAGRGVERITHRRQLEALAASGKDLLVQRIAPGAEHTVHVWVDSQGQAACAVPCRRLAVRAGEVSKALTVKDPEMMRLAADVIEALPGVRGALNVQIFRDDRGAMQVIEINARFGGGYPLADRAGAGFAQWLIEETAGRRTEIDFSGWQDGLTMLRYDEAFFVRTGAFALGIDSRHRSDTGFGMSRTTAEPLPSAEPDHHEQRG